VEQALDGVIFVDPHGRIRIWKHGAKTIFGYAAGEVLDTSLDVIVPERLRCPHYEGFPWSMKTG